MMKNIIILFIVSVLSGCSDQGPYSSLESTKKTILDYGIECTGIEFEFGSLQLNQNEMEKLEKAVIEYDIHCSNSELVFPWL